MLADFSAYPSKERTWLLDQLAVITTELANAYTVFATTQAQERSARVQAFMQSLETTITGRERDADAQCLHLTTEIYKLQGQIKALTEERDLLCLLISHSG